jgi:excinuclease ABC subunit B
LSDYRQTSDRAQAFLAESGVDIDLNETIKELEQEMLSAANNLEFEKAALLRDQVRELKRTIEGTAPIKQPGERAVSYDKGSRKRAAKARG